MFTLGIDPGHGGRNSGSLHGGIPEKELVLELAVRLCDSLMGTGIQIVMTREDDSAVSFAARGAATRDCHAVFSLHHNAHHLAEIKGFETYYWPGNTKGQAIAVHAQQAARAWYTRSRVIDVHNDPRTTADDWIDAPRNVLKCHTPTAVLFECGYLSNPREKEFILSPVGLQAHVSIIRSAAIYAAQIFS